MRVRKLTLREIHLKLLSPFETSFGKTELRRIVLVEADVDGISGWGESTAGEGPFYSYETADTAWLILRDFLWPMVKGREFATASEIWDILLPVRGHNMAKAALETAVWDAEAKHKNVPLAKLIGGTLEEIPCGVSIGLQASVPALLAKVEKELAAGYQRIKIKIKPGNDIALVSALREKFPRIRLMVDANSAYTLADAPMLKALDAFHLIMIEQPLGYDDIFSHAELQRQLETPICLDECIHDPENARAAIEWRACEIINIKLGRVGGHAQAKRMHDLCQANSSRSGAAACLNPASDARTTSRCPRWPTFVFRATFPLVGATGTKTSLSPRSKFRRGTIRVPSAPASATRRASTASSRSPSAAKFWTNALCLPRAAFARSVSDRSV